MAKAALMASDCVVVSVSAVVPSALRAVTVWALMLASGRSVRSRSVKWMVPPLALSSVAESWVLASSVTLPQSVRGSVIQMFDAKIPFVGAAVGYAYAYAEFVLPILLVLGVATRISALLLLIMTVLLQMFFAPEALWTTHVYWASILLVLMSAGPGQVSMDQIFRDIYEK